MYTVTTRYNTAPRRKMKEQIRSFETKEQAWSHVMLLWSKAPSARYKVHKLSIQITEEQLVVWSVTAQM